MGQLHPSVGEVEHFDVKPVGVQLQLFAVGGNHRQLGKDQAAQSIELLVLGEGDVQSLRQLVQVTGAGNLPEVVAQLDQIGLLLGVELVVDVAHDLFQQVLHGHQTRGPAVFVHHNGQVDLFALHIPEQHVGAHRFRNEVGGVEQLPQGLGVCLLGVEQVDPGG